MSVVFVLFGFARSPGSRSPRRCGGAPGFDRFAERAVVFDTHYVGSLPCMPARRDLHRPAQLHAPKLGTARAVRQLDAADPERERRLHPSDQRSPALLRDGGAAYHARYRSFEFIRGQEYDPWKAMVEPPLERRKEIYASRHYGLDTLNDPAARSQVRLRPELIDRQQGAALLTATARDCRRPSTAAAGGHVPVEPPLAPFGNCAILDLLIPTPVLSREPSLTLSPGSRRLVRS